MLREKDDMTKTTETTMTEVDMVFQVATNRILGLTAKVNHWKQRANELEAALGTENAARISAEATRDRALNTGAENVSLQEELQKERSDHEETCRYLADAQARIREIDDTNRSLEGALDRLRVTFRESDVKKQAEILNLRGDLTTARDERDRALEKFCDAKVVKTFDCTIDAIRAEVADLRGTFDAVHFALGIKSGDNIIQTIDKLKRERDCAKDEWDRAEERCKELTEDIEVIRIELRELQKEAVTARQDSVTREEADRVRITELFSDRQRLKAELAVLKDERDELRGKLEASESESRGYYEELSQIRRNTVPGETNTQTQRSHPVRVGEWVEFAGKKSKVVSVGAAGYSLDGQRYCLFSDCTPCDPPPEASHITPEGKQTAEGALPQPGDVVRLVRVPTNDEYPHDSGRWEPNWGGIGDYMRVHYVGSNINGTRVVRAVFGLEWPLSCVEVVKGGDK